MARPGSGVLVSLGGGYSSQSMARVVVWEWLNEHGRWKPYSAAVCHHIENVLKGDARGTVILGQVDPQLTPYVIDLQSMHQFRQDTGESQRHVYSCRALQLPIVADPEWSKRTDTVSTFVINNDSQNVLLEGLQVQEEEVCVVCVWCLMRAVEMMETDGDSDEDRRVPALPVKNLTGSGPFHPALAGMTGILMCAAGLPVCLTRAPKPILHPPPVSKSDLKPVPGINSIRRKTKKKHLRKGKKPEDVVRRYTEKIKTAPDEDCTICMEPLATASGYEGVLSYKGIKPELVGKLGKCGHMYHLLCLVAMYSNGNKDGSLQCPTCKAIYGEKTGTQPPGKMEYHVIPHSLPGYSDTKTIRIVYDIPAGIQTTEHPNPGKKYSARGFPRHCYLPDNEKGRKVLKLLIMAWDRHLIFTIGTSSTTGEMDTVVWNEIHHKTEFGSNLTGHGYPDPNYLDNVVRELAAQGVGEDNLKD
ncbi:E3 ubiquitin-protein ligase DTX1-like [Cyprinus carpio]|uniref:E3 ubiquitin-protein ligase n=1 Tax=Cyprinus carpio TaxID=7962 RepID=A0A9R0B298_CYPCA|nr:E3 ubiquitin-protein ligase DTX1-like [Cyprinus carpio]